ncbi:MAG: folylpolyglutamate synthase/dihydrofolate synthase family protein [Clostridiales bacterium]
MDNADMTSTNETDKMNAIDKTDRMKALDKVSQPTFEEALERVSSFGIEPGLAVILELLRQLGNPQADLAVIHVAGTNGKGSVCSMLESCLREAGLRTGLYTSPHLISYNERFRVNGAMISDQELLALLAETEAAAQRTAAVLDRRATQFEILTAMAFLWFCRQKVDVLVLETGMGGRYDATNVIPRPLMTVITNISLDHESFLGNTTAAIAGEKAGIIKAGTPLVTACDDPAALAVICREFAKVQEAASTPEAAKVSGTASTPEKASTPGVVSVPEAVKAPGVVSVSEAVKASGVVSVSGAAKAEQERAEAQGTAQAEQAGAAALALSQVWQECSWHTKSLGLTGQEVTLTTPVGTYEKLYLPLAGQHQCVNLACVVRAWEILAGTGAFEQRAVPEEATPQETVPQEAMPEEATPQEAVLQGAVPEKAALRPSRQKAILTEDALRRGLQKVSWPCRLELVQEHPQVVLDGSHNPDGLHQLAAWLQENRRDYEKVILVMGMVEDKDRLKAASYLDALVSSVIITKPLSARAGHWQELARGFTGAAGRVDYIEDCRQALEEAIVQAGEKDLVLCTGSFYLVGELRKKWTE